MGEVKHGDFVMVCKKASQMEQKMTSAVYVEQARKLARALEEREVARGMTRPVARARVEARFGLPASLLRSLRYRCPKSIGADVFDKLLMAVEHQAEEQIRTLEHEIATARACRLGVNDGRLREAEIAATYARSLLAERE